jgi:hypothetical protein
MSELLEQSGLQFDHGLHELYIKLLCRFSPEDVYSHLSTHHEYNIDKVLKMCQDAKVNDATAYLLERTGERACVSFMV